MENLQLVLTGDKAVATDLTIFLSQSERDLLVYLGVALLERVENNRNRFAYKMLIGRLVNAGVRRDKLKRQFKHDSRTMKKWAEALKSDDPDAISGAKRSGSQLSSNHFPGSRRMFWRNHFSGNIASLV
jgi:hypothetical protein